LQPTNLKSDQFLEELQSYQANLQVVVAFRMLPEAVWRMPSKGTFNLHASLLPKYRGAAPIHWAIINGETETGLTTFFLKHQIDTGNIIWQEKEIIKDTDTTGTLSARLMIKGAQLVLKTVRSIEEESYTLTNQEFSEAQPKAPKLFKEDCQIDWNQAASEIVNFIRGLNPFPTAWTVINQVVYKIHQAKIIQSFDSDLRLGDYQTDGETYLHFRAKDAAVAVTELQAPGKRKMSIQEFLRGNQL
jgi:methionyl-tRNA formyltransferase